MRHLSAAKNFGRHPAHRMAMLRNMVMNLVEHGRIRTTIQKAKAAKPVAEKLITLGKKGTPHHRRLAITELGSTVAAKKAVRKLFSELKERFATRNGGYTRILRLPTTIRQAKSDLPRGKKFRRSKYYGTRLGDNATLVLWELCEATVTPREKPQKQRRSRKAKPKAPAAQKAPAEVQAEQPAATVAPATTPAEAEQKTAQAAPAEAEKATAEPAPPAAEGSTPQA
ncbi:MAG: 50S ribosomal protein L17 [Planctomycetota bacterium]|nr:50S ribosomal protein L17 [Planctomycetota bacterium]